MFGYLVAATELLTPEQLNRYKACYCGLCRTLKARYGQVFRLTLNYDMTFLVMLLNSLYEPPEETGEGVCLPHPVTARTWWKSQASDYAADMNVALAYLKCLDDWADDDSLVAVAEAGVLRKPYEAIKERLPIQCAAISESLGSLHEMERSRIEDADAAAACFGRLMGAVLTPYEDRWSGTLHSLGDSLGRFIYIMDAAVDLNSDAFRNRYNPFRRYYGLNNNESRFRDFLKMLLGECVREFDRLPLVQDADIMKNILCAGLWKQFDLKYKDKRETSDVSRPV